MSTTLTLDAVYEAALKLPPEERFELADRLMIADAAEETPIDETVRERILQRIASDRSGKTGRIPGDQALRQVRETVLGA